MILVIGGAYQGKLGYVKDAFGITEEDIFNCVGAEIDFSKRCIDRIEEFTYACIQNGTEPKAYFEAHRGAWENSILICQDITCGVVPLGADIRAWRDSTGRLCQYLAAEAEQVSRVFCGLEQRLK